MNYLSLFSGGAGGDLAMQHLLGFRCVGYVEYENYCQRLIKQRIEDGLLDAAPVFGDIRDFNRDYAAAYTGMVDLITGGFPCQPFSVAGKKLGEDDTRNMWPETIKAIRVIRPSSVLLENVLGIRKYLPVVFADLRRSGYVVKRPALIAAASMGGGHIRWRIWLYAYSNEERLSDIIRKSTPKKIKSIRPAAGLENGTKVSPDTDKEWELQQKGHFKEKRGWPSVGSWWKNEPGVVRVVYGIPNGMDRIGALGNAQVPIVAATAFRILAGSWEVK